MNFIKISSGSFFAGQCKTTSLWISPRIFPPIDGRHLHIWRQSRWKLQKSFRLKSWFFWSLVWLEENVAGSTFGIEVQSETTWLLGRTGCSFMRDDMNNEVEILLHLFSRVYKVEPKRNEIAIGLRWHQSINQAIKPFDIIMLPRSLCSVFLLFCEIFCIWPLALTSPKSWTLLS